MITCLASFGAMAAAMAVDWVSAEVTQVHLGVSSVAVGCANGIAVSFATDVATSYRVTGTADGTTVTADSTFVNYRVSEPEHNYSYSSPFLHTALLCDLAEMTTYSYTIGNSEFTGTFVSQLHPGSDKEETILGVIGDPGDTVFSETTFAAEDKTFEDKHIQALVIVGDFSYANGLHAQWDNWFTEQQAFFDTYPLLGINGNHETITSSGHLNKYPYPPDMELEAENYLGYIKRVYTPITEEAKKKLQTWYSVNIGLIHCVFLDDYTGSRGVDASIVGTDEWLAYRNTQLEWVKADLDTVDRSVTPWVVVFKHNPYYNTWIDHQCQCSPTIFEIDNAEKCWNGTYFSEGIAYAEPQCGQMAKLEDVFAANGVNVVISGHVHAYERTAKIFKNKKNNEKGIYYVTTGSGGNYEGHAIQRISSSLIPSWSLASNNVEFGGSRIIATRKSFRFLWFANNNSIPEAVPTDGFTIFAKGPDITTWTQTTLTS